MNYIWELFLKQENEALHVKQADVVSPYYEMPPKQPDGAGESEGLVEYNAMYRYKDIFYPLLTERVGSENLERVYFDILSHYLIQVDLKSGLSYPEYQRRGIMHMLKEGIYGETVRDIYLKMDDRKKYRLAHYVRIAEQTKAGAALFSKALLMLLETGVIYQDKDDWDSYILYVGKPENKEDQEIITIVSQILLPIGKQLRVIWDRHFGICEEDCTMRFDQIEIL